MSYFYDNDNLNPYPTTSANGEHSLLNQPPTIVPLNHQAHNFPTDRWAMVPQLGPTAGPTTSLPGPTGSIGATPYDWGFDGHTQPSYTNPSWLTMNPQPHSGHHGLSGWGNYPSGTTMASVASTTIPTPSSAPLHYWGENQSSHLTSTFDQNVHTPSKSTSGPSRTGPTSTRRFRPYGTSCVWETEQRNMQEGPSTIALEEVPYVGSPTPPPTGGLIPETAADAKEQQQITEGEEAPEEPRPARLRNGHGVPRPGREREQNDFRRLCEFVEQWKGDGTPSRNRALREVLQYIQAVRPAVYWFPCLRTGLTRPCPQNPGHSKSEWERRNVERKLMGQISRYYRRPGDVLGIADREKEKRWMRPLLLKEVLKDLGVPDAPSEPSDDEDSEAAT